MRVLAVGGGLSFIVVVLFDDAAIARPVSV